MRSFDPDQARRNMVEVQLRRRGIRDPRVLEAIGRIPRELFVPEDQWPFAYEDAPIGIGFGQTISQPFMTAFMCQALELTGREVVLDVGTGSGYHAAVLGLLRNACIPSSGSRSLQNRRGGTCTPPGSTGISR